MKELLMNYSAYNIWANGRIAGFLKEIDPSFPEKEQNSSFPSLRKTVYHIWDAETIWLERLKGNSPVSWPSRDFKGDFHQGLNGFLERSRSLAGFVSGLKEEQLLSELSYSSVDGKRYTSRVCDIIQHCVNHSTFHRGQIITMLRNLGCTSLSPTDYIEFCRSQQQVHS
jgi:uncharacterized damage-inducible protein DinB